MNDESTDAPKHFIWRWWSDLNRMRPLLRVPVKLLVFVVVLLLVLFPSPRLFVRQVQRLGHLDQMVEPNAPALVGLSREFEAGLPSDLTARQLQKRVEAFVYKTIPYDWDWNTWGVADYIPTVAELLDKGREDCDGRAVLAASLLRRMGQDACLVTDLRHVWVAVGRDELMGPGGPKSAIGTPTGTQIHWWTLQNVPRSLAFGTAVFPLARELIVIATVVALLSHPQMQPRWLVAGTTLLLVGLVFLRLAIDVAPDFRGFTERNWSSSLGLVHLLAGLTCLWRAARRARRRGAPDVLPVTAA